MSSDDEPYLSVDDLAAKLQVSKKTIYGWRTHVPRRGPRGFRVGKHLRFRQEDIDLWIESLLDDDSNGNPRAR